MRTSPRFPHHLPAKNGTSDGDPMITSESSAHHPPNLPTPPDLGHPVTVHLPRIEGIRVRRGALTKS
ncbi:hypothetical protein JZ751_014563 [Albula glossodonta]|uniref:Uncharacterized protein n=1 Tax=Albula glossodonta TaxID=121402 RepID=A0A8T2MWG5_9TELE|nr:hypothetical protein JZ751_014563 [Albula glossodonta]